LRQMDKVELTLSYSPCYVDTSFRRRATEYHSCALSLIHTGQVMKGGKTKVQSCNTTPQTDNQMDALDAATGAILWQFAAGSAVNAGPAVADGTVSWGSGSNQRLGGNGNNRLDAFS